MDRTAPKRGKIRGALRRLLRAEEGSATVEVVLWIPFFLFLIALIADASLLFNRQAQMLRDVQNANRAYSVGRLTTTYGRAERPCQRLSTDLGQRDGDEHARHLRRVHGDHPHDAHGARARRDSLGSSRACRTSTSRSPPSTTASSEGAGEGAVCSALGLVHEDESQAAVPHPSAPPRIFEDR